MEEDKVIERRVAVLNPAKVNVGVTVFVSIKTDQHNGEWLKRFTEVISAMPEVIGFYRMSGQVDYLLKQFGQNKWGQMVKHGFMQVD